MVQKFKKICPAILGVVAMAPGVALAAVPADLETNVKAIATDIGAIAVMVLGITVAVIGAKWMFKMLKAG